MSSSPFKNYRTLVATEVASLGRREKIALCLICCNRLSPLYSQFVRTEHWGEDSVFRTCRAEARELLTGSRDRISTPRNVLDPYIPDMEDFGTLLGSFALNAGCAHLDLIDQSETDDGHPLGDALLMCYETVSFCVADEDDEMMNREVNWQVDSIKAVRDQHDLLRFVDSNNGDVTVCRLIETTINASTVKKTC